MRFNKTELNFIKTKLEKFYKILKAIKQEMKDNLALIKVSNFKKLIWIYENIKCFKKILKVI